MGDIGSGNIPGLGSSENQLVYKMVYQPEARRKVHQLIGELLDIAEESPELKMSQIITYSQNRDVHPFESLLDNLYGSDRQPNYGLFSREEMLGHIHIGY